MIMCKCPGILKFVFWEILQSNGGIMGVFTARFELRGYLITFTCFSEKVTISVGYGLNIFLKVIL